MWLTCLACWTFSFHNILSSFLVSKSSSSLNLAIPARSSSLAIQYWISYSFPSSNGPSFKPTSWISGQLRLHITLTGAFSKMKSVSFMAVDGFVAN